MPAATRKATYHVCPRCLRATPATAGERFCPNDGSAMITACPSCGSPLGSPYDRYCSRCGAPLLHAAHGEGTAG